MRLCITSPSELSLKRGADAPSPFIRCGCASAVRMQGALTRPHGSLCTTHRTCTSILRWRPGLNPRRGTVSCDSATATKPNPAPGRFWRRRLSSLATPIAARAVARVSRRCRAIRMGHTVPALGLHHPLGLACRRGRDPQTQRVLPRAPCFRPYAASTGIRDPIPPRPRRASHDGHLSPAARRTGFDPREGLRYLQGCYIDIDGPRSLYRVLRRKCAP